MNTGSAISRFALDRPLPQVIQGGMGVAVSSWKLASAVARTGQLGVVSGTALDLVLARRLQDGDFSGAARRALAAFPIPKIAQRVLDRYFRAEGRPANEPYTPIPRLGIRQSKLAQELMILGAFVEVWLAKEGHDGLVGINCLEKIQMATPATAYGSMLANVDYVVMGAGIPRDIPALLDDLAEHLPTSIPVEVAGAGSTSYTVDLDPQALIGQQLPPLRRPAFLAIVSAHALAAYLARDAKIRPDGFIVEGSQAGGHNAPPRGQMVLDDLGQPIFGPRDEADISKVAAVGLPFWLAGGRGTPEGLSAALTEGAVGVQVGTLFALAKESGLEPEIRADLLARLQADTLEVRTDALASPTGFPFKVAQVPGTLTDLELLEARPRLCDLGYLRTPFVKETGALGYRCKAEPVHMFERKGGEIAETVGRQCLCNSLAANVGLGQTRADGYVEPPLVTLGADLDGAKRMADRTPDWSADEAVEWLLGSTLASTES